MSLAFSYNNASLSLSFFLLLFTSILQLHPLFAFSLLFPLRNRLRNSNSNPLEQQKFPPHPQPSLRLHLHPILLFLYPVYYIILVYWEKIELSKREWVSFIQLRHSYSHSHIHPYPILSHLFQELVCFSSLLFSSTKNMFMLVFPRTKENRRNQEKEMEKEHQQAANQTRSIWSFSLFLNCISQLHLKRIKAGITRRRKKNNIVK